MEQTRNELEAENYNLKRENRRLENLLLEVKQKIVGQSSLMGNLSSSLLPSASLHSLPGSIGLGMFPGAASLAGLQAALHPNASFWNPLQLQQAYGRPVLDLPPRSQFELQRLLQERAVLAMQQERRDRELLSLLTANNHPTSAIFHDPQHAVVSTQMSHRMGEGSANNDASVQHMLKRRQEEHQRKQKRGDSKEGLY